MDNNLKHNIVSFYSNNINYEIVSLQKEIFNNFNIPLEQYFFTTTHGTAIKTYLENSKWDIVTIFDVDCIPLSNDVINNVKNIINDKTIYGNAQISNSTPYAAPNFISFTKKLYDNSTHKIFEGMFYPNEFGVLVEADCTEVFVKENVKNGSELVLSYPISSINEKWEYFGNNIYKPFKYGNGTTFDSKTYHHFQIRFNEEQDNFIKFCKKILNKK
jgi:hypothetical protein